MGIVVTNLTKSLGMPPHAIIKDLSFTIQSGEFIAVTGRSGSGKSTLLYLISTLDKPTSGTIAIDSHVVGTMKDEELHRFRNEYMGFVFQSHYLLPEVSALENILIPARKTHRERELRARAKELMNAFDLSSKLASRPSELSGGEQQRVAIARALIMSPRYIFADEPTGSLDSVNGGIVMNILRSISHDNGATVIVVTHDADYAAMADRRLVIADGTLTQESASEPGSFAVPGSITDPVRQSGAGIRIAF